MSPDTFTRQACATALKTMFSGRHFNICTIDDCLKAAGITPIASQYQALRLLHCVNWSDMDVNMRRDVMARTMALFADGTVFDLSVIDRGFMLEQSPNIGSVINQLDGPEKKRGFLGLVSKRP